MADLKIVGREGQGKEEARIRRIRFVGNRGQLYGVSSFSEYTSCEFGECIVQGQKSKGCERWTGRKTPDLHKNLVGIP